MWGVEVWCEGWGCDVGSACAWWRYDVRDGGVIWGVGVCEGWGSGCDVEGWLYWCENCYWTNSSTLKLQMWSGHGQHLAFLSPHQREDRALIDAGRNTGIGLPLLMLHRREHHLAQVRSNQRRFSKYWGCSCRTALDQLSKRYKWLPDCTAKVYHFIPDF